MDDLEIMDLSTDELIKSYEETKSFMAELYKEIKTLEDSLNEKRNKE